MYRAHDLPSLPLHYTPFQLILLWDGENFHHHYDRRISNKPKKNRQVYYFLSFPFLFVFFSFRALADSLISIRIGPTGARILFALADFFISFLGRFKFLFLFDQLSLTTSFLFYQRHRLPEYPRILRQNQKSQLRFFLFSILSPFFLVFDNYYFRCIDV